MQTFRHLVFVIILQEAVRSFCTQRLVSVNWTATCLSYIYDDTLMLDLLSGCSGSCMAYTYWVASGEWLDFCTWVILYTNIGWNPFLYDIDICMQIIAFHVFFFIWRLVKALI